MSRARDIADIGEDVTSLATDAELSSGLASKLPYSYGTATPSTSVDGFLWYDENDTPPTPKFWDGAAFQALTSGKILQVVRATDSTNRSTTSTSFTDASISVTITPTKSNSAVLLLWVAESNSGGTNGEYVRRQITDSSNNAISGAEDALFGSSGNGDRHNAVLIAYATPATTSAVTYKGRFRSNGGSVVSLANSNSTGQMYAIEVAA